MHNVIVISSSTHNNAKCKLELFLVSLSLAIVEKTMPHCDSASGGQQQSTTLASMPFCSIVKAVLTLYGLSQDGSHIYVINNNVRTVPLLLFVLGIAILCMLTTPRCTKATLGSYYALFYHVTKRCKPSIIKDGRDMYNAE